MAEIRVDITVSGADQAGSALDHIRKKIEEAKRNADEAGKSTRRLTDEQRALLMATRDLSQTLSATTQVLRLVGKENAALEEATVKVQTALTASTIALNLYRNAAQLAAGATTLLAAATKALLGPLGLVIAAAGLLVTAVGAAVVAIKRKREAAEQAARSLAVYEAQAARTAAATEQLRHAQREGQLTALDFARGQELARRAIQRQEEEQAQAAEREAERARAERARVAEERAAIEATLDAAAAERVVEEALQRTLPAIQGVQDAWKEFALDVASGTSVLREFISAWLEVQSSLSQNELEQVVIPRARKLAESLRGVVFDARDARQALQDIAPDEIIPPNNLQDLIEAGQALEGLGSEALRTRMRLGETAEGSKEAFDVLRSEVQRAADDAARALQDLADRASANIGTALERILTGTGSFGDLWTALWKTIIDRVIQEILRLKAVQAFIGGILSFALGIFGIKLQRGGQIVAMRPLTLTIAERGPEQATIQPLANPQVARVVLAARPTPLVVGQRPERVTVTPLPAGTPIPPRGLQSVVTDLPTPRVRLVTPLQPLNPPALATLSTLGRGAFGIPTGVALPGVSGPRLAVQPSVPTVVAGAPVPIPRFERPEREIQEIFSTGGGITGPAGGGGGGGGGIQFLQRGGEILAVRPTAIVAGERGPERVRVEPAAGPAVGSPVTIIFQGPTFVDDLTWSRMRRQLVDTLRDPAGLLWRRPGG